MTYANEYRQIRHSKRLTGKFFIPKGLHELTKKASDIAGAFFDSVLIITGWTKLPRKWYLACFHGDERILGLTCNFAEEFEV